MDRTTFLKNLRRSRLLSEAEFQDLGQRFPADTPAPSLAQALVTDNRLTPYQAQQLLSGKSRRLVLGQYRILEEIGRGGMGQVYKAMHTVMGRVVALKVIASEGVADSHTLALFRREVQAATLLHHTNLVLAHDANECDGIHFLVMEYVDGPNLDAIIKRYGPLPVWLACELMRQAAEALRYAVGKGMVHRDIKPANLLLAGWDPAILSDGGTTSVGIPVVKVLDFGIARLRISTAETLPVRDSGHLIGTPDFISPEQAHDIHAADIRSDLYSLGCTFYFALTGRVPFPGESALEKVLHHALEEPAPPESYRSELPAEVAAMVTRLMEKNPEHRYQTPEELIRALRPWCRPPSAADATSASPDHADEEAEAAETVVEEPAAEDESEGEVDLAQAWQAWMQVVADFLQGYGNRSRLTPNDYAALHAAVLQVCHERARQSPAVDRRVIHRLRERIEPWLSLEVLGRTDHAILSDLLTSCRQLEPVLWDGRPPRPSQRWPFGILALTAGGAFLAWLLVLWLTRQGLSAWTHTLSEEFHTHPLLWGAGICSAVVLMAIYLVARLPRT